MLSKISDSRLLGWFLAGGKVWKSRNKGWFARGRGARVFGETSWGSDARAAAEAAISNRIKGG